MLMSSCLPPVAEGLIGDNVVKVEEKGIVGRGWGKVKSRSKKQVHSVVRNGEVFRPSLKFTQNTLSYVESSNEGLNV